MIAQLCTVETLRFRSVRPYCAKGNLDMPDDRSRRGSQDRSRINMGEDYEVEYWTKTFGISKDRLAEIVNKVGDSVQAVRRELGK